MWFCAVLVIVTALAYANSLQGAFLFDDRLHIVENPVIRQLLPITRFLDLRLRWFVNLSFALNYSLAGLEPAGYHVVNLVVHLCAGLLLFALTRIALLSPGCAAALRRRPDGLAFAMTLIWMVHPLNTQAVTYVVQRYESMMGLFYLLLLYCVARSARSRRPWPWFARAWVSFVLGLGCKEVMVTSPVVALLYDRVFLAASWRELLRRRGWLHAGLLGMILFGVLVSLPTMLNRFEGVGIGFGQKYVTAGEYARTQPGVILHYLRLAAWPDRLCFDYGWMPASSPLQMVVPGVLVGVLVAGSLWCLWRRPAVGFLGCTFFVVLAPSSSVVPIRDLAVEHRMYVPLTCVIALAVAAVWLGAHALHDRFGSSVDGCPGAPASRRIGSFSRPEALAGTCLAVAAIVLAARTAIRNYDYWSAETIWRGAVAIRPCNERANHNLAIELESQDRRGEAISIVRDSLVRCVAAGVPHADLHLLLGELLARDQRPGEAMPHLSRAIQMLQAASGGSQWDREKVAEAWVSTGTAYEAKRDWANAEACYRRGIALRADFAPPYAMLGHVLVQQGRRTDAIQAWERALALQPNWPAVHSDLGKAYLETGRDKDAKEHLQRWQALGGDQ